MHKKIALFAAAAAIGLPLVSVFADEAVTTTAMTTAQKEIRQQKSIEKRVQASTGVALDDEQGKQKRQEFKDTFQDKFQNRNEKMAEAKCKKVESRVQNRLGRYENNQKMLQNVYGNMTTRLNRLVARLDEAKADTTKLKADLVTLQAMINKTYSDNAAFIETMKTTQTSTCGSTEGDFKTKLGESRKVLALVKQDRADIREFFKTTIRPDLQAIRQQFDTENGDEATEESADQDATETDEIKGKKIKTPETPTEATLPDADATTTPTAEEATTPQNN